MDISTLSREQRDALEPAIQAAADLWVKHNIDVCQTSLVDDLMSSEALDGEFSVEQLDNGYVYICPDCGHQETDADAFEFPEDKESEEVYMCPSCKYEFSEEPEYEAQEILEWWTVGSMTASELTRYGEPVLDNAYGCWWGRTTSGQGISLDSVVHRIVCDYEDSPRDFYIRYLEDYKQMTTSDAQGAADVLFPL